MPAHSDSRSYRPRLRAVLAALVGAVALMLVPGAYAQDYAGQTATWGKLTASITSGSLTAFTTTTGFMQTCNGQPGFGSQFYPVKIAYAGTPVAVAAGAFQLTGQVVGATGDHITYTVAGTLSKDEREVTGTITATGLCAGTWPFDAVIAPAAVTPSPVHAFSPDTTSLTPSSVAFDYAQGAISHLSATLSVTCTDGTKLPAALDTSAYGIDPIHVSKSGRFSVSGAVVDTYGAINHYVIAGQVVGKKASGSITASRLFDTGAIDGKDVVTCSSTGTWSAVQATAAPVGPTAFYQVSTVRTGSAGAWRYAVKVTFSGCKGATKVTVTVAGGPHLTAPCRGSVKLGPLQPQAMYTVTVGAIPKPAKGHKAAAPVAGPPSLVYMPGDDGIWLSA